MTNNKSKKYDLRPFFIEKLVINEKMHVQIEKQNQQNDVIINCTRLELS